MEAITTIDPTNQQKLSIVTDDDREKCNNCKCWRKKEDFIGKSGQSVKQCLRCREKNAVTKAKPEAREAHRQLDKDNQYYKAYREGKREQDDDAFKKHNAEVMRKWRAKKEPTKT